MIAGLRLRAGRANSAKGAARMLAQAIRTARAISADTTILVRGDSAFGSRAVMGTCLRHGAQFSVATARNSAIDKAIAAIGDHAWTPVSYPGAGAIPTPALGSLTPRSPKSPTPHSHPPLMRSPPD